MLADELCEPDSEPLCDDDEDWLSLWLADPDSEREPDWLPDSLPDCDSLFEPLPDCDVLPEPDWLPDRLLLALEDCEPDWLLLPELLSDCDSNEEVDSDDVSDPLVDPLDPPDRLPLRLELSDALMTLDSLPRLSIVVVL